MTTPDTRIEQASCYLVLERDRRRPSWRPPTIVKMTKAKPALAAGQFAIKVKVNVPMSLFETLVPVAEVTVSEPDVIAPAIELDPEVV